MNKLNLPPFYVGQKIVCVIGHKDGQFKKGDVFKVQSIKRESCCGNWVVNIGLRTDYCLIVCQCGHINNNDDYYSCNRFKPLEEMNAPLLTFQQIKEVEKEEVLILN